MINRVKRIKKVIISAFTIFLLLLSANSIYAVPVEWLETGLGFKVRKSHPRLLVSDWQALINKIYSDPLYKAEYDILVNNFRSIPVAVGDLSNAPNVIPDLFVGRIKKTRGEEYSNLKTVIFGEGGYVETVISKCSSVTSRGGTTALVESLILDWFYDDFPLDLNTTTSTKRNEYVSCLKARADSFLNKGGYRYGKTPYGSGVYTAYGSMVSIALAIYGEIDGSGITLERAKYHFKDRIIPAYEQMYSVNGGSKMGPNYDFTPFNSASGHIIYSALWESATNDSLRDEISSFAKMPLYYMYTIRDYNRGDWLRHSDGGAGSMYGVEQVMFKEDYLYAWSYFAKKFNDPVAVYMRNKSLESTVKAAKDYSKVLFLIFDDNEAFSQIAPLSLSDTALDLSKEFKGLGIVSMRESFEDNSAIKISYKATDIYPGHEHDDAGHFEILKDGIFLTDSGRYGKSEERYHVDYSRLTIAHNTLTIYDPEEKFIHYNFNINNEGGQIRSLHGYFDALPFPSNPLPDRNDTVRGRLDNDQDVEFVPGQYDYIFTDFTRAYNSQVGDSQYLSTKDKYSPSIKNRPKVSKVTRELVYLRREKAVLVFDRIKSTDKSFKKRFLLHTVFEPELDGSFSEGTANIYGGTAGHKSVNSNLTTLFGAKVLPAYKVLHEGTHSSIKVDQGKFIERGLSVGDRIRFFNRGTIRNLMLKDVLVSEVVGGDTLKVAELLPKYNSGSKLSLKNTGIAVKTGEKLFVKTVFPLSPEIKIVGGPNSKGEYNRGVEAYPLNIVTRNDNNGIDRSYEAYVRADDLQTGNEYENWVSSLKNGFGYGLSAIEGFGYRVEVSPSKQNLNDNFLHLFFPVDRGINTPPDSINISVESGNINTDDMIGVHIKNPDVGAVALFSRTENFLPDNRTIKYTIAPEPEVRHYLFDMQPNRLYKVLSDKGVITVTPAVATGNNVYTSSVEGVLTFSTTAGQRPPAPSGFKIRRR